MNYWKRAALFVCPCLTLLFLLPLAAPLPLAAQAQPAVLAASSPEVYEAFFRFHDDLSRWSDQRKSLNALEAPSLDSAVARHLKLDPSELNKLNAGRDFRPAPAPPMC